MRLAGWLAKAPPCFIGLPLHQRRHSSYTFYPSNLFKLPKYFILSSFRTICLNNVDDALCCLRWNTLITCDRVRCISRLIMWQTISSKSIRNRAIDTDTSSRIRYKSMEQMHNPEDSATQSLCKLQQLYKVPDSYTRDQRWRAIHLSPSIIWQCVFRESSSN